MRPAPRGYSSVCWPSAFGEHHVGRLDHRGHLVALGELEAVDRLDRGRSDDALTGHLDLYVGEPGPAVDAATRAAELVACAQFHACQCRRSQAEGTSRLTLKVAPCLSH